MRVPAPCSFGLTLAERLFIILNMCSAIRESDHADRAGSADQVDHAGSADEIGRADRGERPAQSDKTARARIRDAALLLFGRDGFAATTLRRVAQEAGVSAALVIHHYGSKEGLREACDRYVSQELVESGREELDRDLVGTMREWLTDTDRYQAAFDYLVRMLTSEGSQAGAALFDALLAQTQSVLAESVAAGQVRESQDAEAMAVVLATTALAPLVLGSHVGRALGGKGLDAPTLARYMLPVLEVFTHGLYLRGDYLDAVKSVTGGDT